MRVSDDWKYLYVCGCRLYACIITRKFRYVFHYPKITYPKRNGFPYLGTHIPSDMYAPTQETHINSDMCSPTWETYPQSYVQGKCISLGILSQVVCGSQTPRLVGGLRLPCRLLSLVLLLLEISLTTLYGERFESLKLPYLALNFIK